MICDWEEMCGWDRKHRADLVGGYLFPSEFLVVPCEMIKLWLFPSEFLVWDDQVVTSPRGNFRWRERDLEISSSGWWDRQACCMYPCLMPIYQCKNERGRGESVMTGRHAGRGGGEGAMPVAPRFRVSKFCSPVFLEWCSVSTVCPVFLSGQNPKSRFLEYFLTVFLIYI